MTKRWGHLLEQVCTYDNLEWADKDAQRGKDNIGIKIHKKHIKEDLLVLQKNFENLTYKTSKYSTFKIYEPKERIIFRLPFYPDRIAHHAIMNIMEERWVSIMITHTYACIKQRGIHALAERLKKDLRKDVTGTRYCLKLDVHKFYPSINHEILKSLLRKKIKDYRLLSILDEIVNSSAGVPIGNYLSQFFANIYLTYFDHYAKEVLHIRYYYRYCDDIVILADNKEILWEWFKKLKVYLENNLKLVFKPNYQVFPVESRGIDYVGYVFYHTHTLLRKSIKLRLKRLVNNYLLGKITKDEFLASFTSYYGWLKHCNSKHLLQIIEYKTGVHLSSFCGKLDKISHFKDKNVFIVECVKHNKYTMIHFIYHSKPYEVSTKSKALIKTIGNWKCRNFKFKGYGKRKQSKECRTA